MYNKYLNDYYRHKITLREICEKEGIYQAKFYNWLKMKNLPSYNSCFNEFNFQNKKLRNVLVKKYTSITNRCKGKSGDKYGHYNGMEFLSIIDYVGFCNDNKKLLESMWETYVNNDNNLKYAISIDRINDSKGYLVSNMQFVTHGLNSWKRTVERPIKAKLKTQSEWHYFMSCAEGCRHFGIRDRDFGEIIRKDEYYNKDYEVQITDIDTVLNKTNCKNIEEYYKKFIQ